MIKIKSVPKETMDLNIHQCLELRKMELASKEMAHAQLREILLEVARTTMSQQNVIKFLMVEND